MEEFDARRVQAMPGVRAANTHDPNIDDPPEIQTMGLPAVKLPASLLVPGWAEGTFEVLDGIYVIRIVYTNHH